MPRELNTENKKKRAGIIIEWARKYTKTLEDLINHHEFKELIHTLEAVPIDGIKLQAHDIQTLLEDINHTLLTIYATLRKLENIVKRETMTDEDKINWSRHYDEIVLMIHQKFGDEKGELRREFEIVLHTEELLRKIVKYEHHLEHLLKL